MAFKKLKTIVNYPGPTYVAFESLDLWTFFVAFTGDGLPLLNLKTSTTAAYSFVSDDEHTIDPERQVLPVNVEVTVFPFGGYEQEGGKLP